MHYASGTPRRCNLPHHVTTKRNEKTDLRPRSSVFEFQAVRDIPRSHEALFDHAPFRLSDIDGAGSGTFAAAAIEHQVHAAIHHAEDLNTSATGGRAGNIRTGCDEGLIEARDELIRHDGPCLTNRKPPGVAGCTQRNGGRGGRKDAKAG